jgi:alpha-galactosidase
MDPLPCWQAADDGGLAHLGHIAGLWETVEWLRATFPDLVVENCASGGNRLDWTLFSRATVNFANDQYTQPDCIRRILGRMAAFLPSERVNMIFGPYQWHVYDDADWQVLQGSAFGVSEPIENWTAGFVEGLRRQLALHRANDAARRGGFYRLTPDTPELHAWEGWQMHDPATGRGVVALWRSRASDDHLVARLRGLDPSQTYVVTDLYAPTAEGQTLRGAELRISLPPTGAALQAYRPAG